MSFVGYSTQKSKIIEQTENWVYEINIDLTKVDTAQTLLRSISTHTKFFGFHRHENFPQTFLPYFISTAFCNIRISHNESVTQRLREFFRISFTHPDYDFFNLLI